MPAASTDHDHRIDWRRAALVAVIAIVAPVLAATLALLLGGSGAAHAPVVASRLWLFSVGGSLTAAGQTFGQVPLGGALVAAAGVWAALRIARVRGQVADPGAFAAVCGGLAAVLAAVLSLVTAIGPGGTSFVRSAFGAFVVVAGTTAVALQWRGWWTGPSIRARLLRSATAGALVVLVAAFALLMVQLLRGIGTAANLWATLGPGAGGAIALGLLCLLALPTLTAWTAAVLLGPGVALGQSTHIDLTGVDVGALPAFPPLAAIPDPGPFGGWVLAFALVPVIAGAVAGWLVVDDAEPATRCALMGAAAGASAGAAIGVVLALSGGAVGPGALRTAGPAIAEPLLIAVPTLAVGGAVGALLAHYRGARAHD